MPMGEHETGQISPHLFDEAYVRDDEVYPREIGARECHPAIDHQPFQVSLAAKAVKREVHADFAQTTKRHKDELVVSFVHLHEPSSTLERVPIKQNHFIDKDAAQNQSVGACPNRKTRT